MRRGSRGQRPGGLAGPGGDRRSPVIRESHGDRPGWGRAGRAAGPVTARGGRARPASWTLRAPRGPAGPGRRSPRAGTGARRPALTWLQLAGLPSPRASRRSGRRCRLWSPQQPLQNGAAEGRAGGGEPRSRPPPRRPGPTSSPPRPPPSGAPQGRGCPHAPSPVAGRRRPLAPPAPRWVLCAPPLFLLPPSPAWRLPPARPCPAHLLPGTHLEGRALARRLPLPAPPFHPARPRAGSARGGADRAAAGHGA